MGPVQGVLLAAGEGRRFSPEGREDKLLAPLPDGRSVLWHSASTLVAALPGSLAVIQPHQHERRALLQGLGFSVIESIAAVEGMGHALAAAVAATRAARGWVVALGDMPWLPAAVIAEVANRLRAPECLVAPTYQGRRGHPVAFGAHWGGALTELHGDTGARDLLGSAHLATFEVADAGVVRDVDTPADLALSRTRV